ncbi:hypothetical protein CMO91_05605 [Candidatus Woesearchaeota archaeon]|jgi:predicted CopG family antitoxin|nr:hypothetical protein [Candidatus Woesearchaeota archaeon]|tara:strand:- start:1522 stop:1725 length:204 start_codon:yes stop_codon:yes gene_type:complete
MATTIQVSETTRQQLEILKNKERSDSFDKVIEKLLDKQLKIPKTMLGKIPQLSKFTKADKRGTFNEL